MIFQGGRMNNKLSENLRRNGGDDTQVVGM
jgi:hypothetical protein